MDKRIITIPATLNRFTSAPVYETAKRKVAGYARVSTDYEEQQTSYEAQMDYYRNYIMGRSDWEFAGMYSDEGITATNTRHREGFNRMIADALAGKIDLIVTKSISRFARNTVDSLTTIRKLKEHGTEVYFEKENIWTFDSKGELLLTIMSSLAQEESRSISENTTWGKRKAFADGKVSVAYSRFLGYDKDFVINEEQAETVRLIYKLFLSGMSIYGIAKELMKRGIKAPSGGEKWHVAAVEHILTNEKYKGSALLQKKFTVDYLQKKTKKNEGEVTQYYIENHHKAIISPEIYQLVQAEFQRRGKNPHQFSGVNLFSSKIKCGDCGGWYGPKVWHSNQPNRKQIFRCNQKYHHGEGKKCTTPYLTEEEIKRLFLKALNQLVKEKNATMENLEALLRMLSGVNELEGERVVLIQEKGNLEPKLQEIIKESGRSAESREEYERRYHEVYEQYERCINRLKEISSEIEDRKTRSAGIRSFIDSIGKVEGEHLQFDEQLWTSIVYNVTVYSKSRIVFTFIGGIEVTVQ